MFPETIRSSITEEGIRPEKRTKQKGIKTVVCRNIKELYLLNPSCTLSLIPTLENIEISCVMLNESHIWATLGQLGRC